ncbi:MAG: hypothetical protein RBS99_17225, partial [Rhodospirillales bacterium]|nr:hypothetical protein [Rhodospirillales bacterium]
MEKNTYKKAVFPVKEAKAMANLAYTSMKGLTDLLREADPQTKTHVWVLSFTELAVGSEPGNPQKIIDLSMETDRKSV